MPNEMKETESLQTFRAKKKNGLILDCMQNVPAVCAQ